MPTPGSVSPNVASFSPRACGHEPALALLLGPPLEEGQRVEPDVDALDDTERGVGTLQLLAQDREADVVHPGAAVRLGDRRAEEARARPSSRRPRDGPRPSRPTRGCTAGSRPRRRRGRCSLDEPVLVGQGEVDHAPASLRGRTRPRRCVGRDRDRGADTTRPRWTRPPPPTNLTPVLGRYFERELEPRRGPSAVRHGRPAVPRLRQRDRGHALGHAPSAGHGRDPRPGRPADRADQRDRLHGADLAAGDRRSRRPSRRRSTR